MIKVEENKRIVPHPQQLIYDVLSSIENLAKLRSLLPMTSDGFKHDHNSMTFAIDRKTELRVILLECESPHMIRYAVEKMMIPIQVQIELSPKSETETFLLLTATSNVNDAMRAMFSKMLKEGAHNITGLICSIPFDEIDI
jgi:hypothetical protein